MTPAELLQQLIRFDTTNFGGGDSRGERACAEWVAEQLSDAGYTPLVLESAPGRASRPQVEINALADQLSRRGGALSCALHGDRVTIAGRGILYLEGRIEI